jgi:hypothetical protein
VVSPGQAQAHPKCVKLETPKPGRTVVSNACGECQAVVVAVGNGCGVRKLSQRLEAGKSHLLQSSDWPKCADPGMSSTAALDEIKPCKPASASPPKRLSFSDYSDVGDRR